MNKPTVIAVHEDHDYLTVTVNGKIDARWNRATTLREPDQLTSAKSWAFDQACIQQDLGNSISLEFHADLTPAQHSEDYDAGAESERRTFSAMEGGAGE